jgi:DNA (cytosine-5)-methyltransferase 1
VLDAQNFGVAQRRKRVFVVGHFGDWKPAAEVLFESESLSGDIKKGRQSRKEVAATITARFGNSRNNHEELAPVWPAKTASTINASFGSKLGLENQHINSGAPLFVPAYVESSFGQYREDVIAGTSKASGGALGGGSETFITHCVDTFPTLLSSTAGVSRPGNAVTEHQTYIAFGWQNSSHQGMSVDTISPTLDKSKTPATMQNMAVRRLTPVECERLQGFPDDYTNIKENCPDGPRYKALGNSMAVPVMRWIGERINQYEQRGMEKHL